jgi:DNA invertase Pin-like site-specific DNA recombinase
VRISPTWRPGTPGAPTGLHPLQARRHDGAIAEFQHALTAERTRDGLAAVRARGRSGGQKPKLTPRQAKIAQAMYDELGADGRLAYTVQQIADEFGVTRPTINRHLQHRIR